MALGLALLALAACGGGGSAGAPGTAVPSDVAAAPQRVLVEGRTYTLVVDLGRDVMPRVPPASPSGIQGTIFLRADAESNAPEGLRAERAWLIRGGEARELVPEPLQTLTVDRRSHLSLGLRGGPVWDVGSRVDVVLRFSAAGRTYLIAARGVEVIGYA
ncbi:MAG TPA: hypothetical protein VFW12_00465 [Candidatus Limnocylindria bacterium]|nr:hypothetical protein [Candidatus Limnocylindria bacterium]